MDQRSFLEGARALALWGAHLIDRSHLANDADAEGLVSLMTPVIKGFLTDKGFETTVLAQQVLGGHGYVEEWGMSQFVRDARITMIYEGANGVQALDLVGRKLAQDGGKYVMAFFELIKSFCQEQSANEAVAADYIEPLKAASKDLQAAAMFFMERGMKSPNDALAGSYDFMHLFGHVDARLHVGPDGRRSPRAAGRGDWRCRLPEDQAGNRALLHDAAAADDRNASCPHPLGRRAGDGAGGRGVLTRR